MKKILSLGIASAVLALTAVSASAAIAVKTDDKIVKGSKITVNFSADEALSLLQFTVDATGVELVPGSAVLGNSGATYDAATKTYKDSTGLTQFNENSMSFGKVGASTAGESVLSLTFTVTADTGASVKIGAKDLIGGDNKVSAEIDAKVAVDTTSSTTSSDTTSSTTSSDTTSSTTSSDTTTSSTTSSDSQGTTNPPTGVALAVFPAVIAGAAVVVAKKKRG